MDFDLQPILFLTSALGFSLLAVAFWKLLAVKKILAREQAARRQLQEALALRAADTGPDMVNHADEPTVPLTREHAVLEQLRERYEHTKQELTRLRIRVEKQSLERHRAKDSFLAHMSHEMRTPLNIILGYSELLEDRASDESLADMREDIAKVHTAGSQMLEKVNHVLELSKIRAGRVHSHYDLFALNDLVEELQQTFEPLFEERGNDFVLEAPEVSDRLEIDLGKLHQILERLLINANRFTENGTIALEVTTEQVHALPWIHFTIRDNGRGIDPEKLNLLFKGVLSPNAGVLTESEEGGLGLALCQSLAQLLGGKLTLESTLNVGTNAVLSVPALRGEGGGLAKVSEATAEGYRVVFVGDNSARQRALAENTDNPLLKWELVDPVDLDAQILGKSSPTLVLIDVMMDMSVASSVFIRLREQTARNQAHLMLISMFDYIGETLALGVLGYLVKPVAEARLHLILSALFQDRPDQHILLVSGDTDQLHSLNDVLATGQRRTEAVQRGSDAIRYLDAHQPQLLIVDLVLHDMDGFSLLENLHERGLARVPVVFLASGLPGHETALDSPSRITHIPYFEEPFTTDFKKHLLKEIALAFDRR
ncbi:ATP-binding protein [Acanthopleuribacter pedis]|uniref:histidine kinase n=1 Tax=Acanthopleuribacter pedis TaxID=442870 RepID=A0A8J7QLC6_9BACT|nr:ATP-binding protein [Acanthopleuribacter pedis]MBO1323231.1 response regulator [Acanthopleuribacter pedis]